MHLTVKSTKTLVNAIVIFRIDYCNCLPSGIAEDDVNTLQRLQNAAARLVTKQRKYDHITATLATLHYLPVRARMKFKILLWTFKCLHLGPKYRTDLLQIL